VNDTTSELQAVHRRMLLSRSPAERVRMGFDMYDTARSIVLASLREEGEDDLPVRLFRRFYGRDFPPGECEVIEARIREYHAARPVRS